LLIWIWIFLLSVRLDNLDSPDNLQIVYAADSSIQIIPISIDSINNNNSIVCIVVVVVIIVAVSLLLLLLVGSSPAKTLS